MDISKIPANATDDQLADLDLTRDEFTLLQQKAAGTAPQLQTAASEEDEAARVAAEAAAAEKAAADAAAAKAAEDAAAAKAAEDAAAAAAAAAPAAPAEPAPAAEAAAPAPAVPRYDVGDPAQIDEKLAALDKKVNDAFTQLMDGTIDQEAYTKVANEAKREERVLVAQQTLHVANMQAEQQAQVQALEALATSAAKPEGGGIDYKTDVAAQKQFDVALSMIHADPDNAKLTFPQVLEKAHDAVLAIRGKSRAAAPAPTPAAPAAAPAAKPVIPQTLSALPAAAASPVGNDLMTQIAGSDDPDEAEAMLAAMPAAQRANLLRSTIKH